MLGIFLDGIRSSNLSILLLGNNQTSNSSAVDFLAKKQIIQITRQLTDVNIIMTIGVYRHNIVLFTHSPPLPYSTSML